MTMVDMRAKLGELAAIDATRRAREAVERRGSPVRLAWYVVQSVHGSDKHAVEWLTRCGFETYYPKTRKAKPVPRKRQSQKQRRAMFPPTEMIDVPLFPRYVFVHFDPRTGGWHEQFEVAGVGGMLCYGGTPAPISDLEIDKIRGGEIEGAIPAATPVRFIITPGMQVRILEGPFAQFFGTVDRGIDVAVGDLAADARIKVLASLFGRQTPLELEINQVEVLNSHPE